MSITRLLSMTSFKILRAAVYYACATKLSCANSRDRPICVEMCIVQHTFFVLISPQDIFHSSFFAIVSSLRGDVTARESRTQST